MMCVPRSRTACFVTQYSASPTRRRGRAGSRGAKKSPSRAGRPGRARSEPGARPSIRREQRQTPPALNGLHRRQHRPQHQHRAGPEQRERRQVADAAEQEHEAVLERLAHLAAVPAQVEDEREEAASATRPRPIRSRWRCSSSGRRGIASWGFARPCGGPLAALLGLAAAGYAVMPIADSARAAPCPARYLGGLKGLPAVAFRPTIPMRARPECSWSRTTPTSPACSGASLGMEGYDVRLAGDGEAALDESGCSSPTRWCSTSASPGWTASRWPTGCARTATCRS